jgi:molybdate transport system substrate-binding protein
MNARATAALLAVVTLLPAQTMLAQDAEIRVFCSNGFRSAMEKLSPEAERISGRRMKIEFGPSANFRKSIEAGEPFDLTILTPQIIEDLIKEGKIAAGTKVDLASSGIGVAVRAGRAKPDISSAVAIKKMLLNAKSIGYVKVGAGTPAVLDMFNGLGISKDVESKTVLQEGAGPSMKSIASGQVDVAFGLISEIIPAPGVQLAGPIPPEFQRRIIMSSGIAASTKNREAASAIVKSLTSAAAATAIQSTGLEAIR